MRRSLPSLKRARRSEHRSNRQKALARSVFHRRLSCEALEDRRLLSSGTTTILPAVMSYTPKKTDDLAIYANFTGQAEVSALDYLVKLGTQSYTVYWDVEVWDSIDLWPDTKLKSQRYHTSVSRDIFGDYHVTKDYSPTQSVSITTSSADTAVDLVRNIGIPTGRDLNQDGQPDGGVAYIPLGLSGAITNAYVQVQFSSADLGWDWHSGWTTALYDWNGTNYFDILDYTDSFSNQIRSATITTGSSFSGSISPEDDVDVMGKHFDAGKKYRFVVDSDYSMLRLTGGPEGLIEQNISIDSSYTGNGDAYLWDCPSSGNYYMAVWAPLVSSYSVTIAEVPVLSGITISGPTQANESSTTSYTCMANFSDGSSQNVTSSANWSENSSYASIGASTGVLTTSSVTSDQACRITATYSGMTDTHDLTIKNSVSVLTSIVIGGPTQVNESSTANYTCTAYFDDGSTQNVTSSASWSENSSYASIGANTGVLTTSSVTSDQACQITATYSGKTDTHDVTIKNLAAVLTSIVIGGPTQVNESSTANYTCTAYFDDGSTQNVTSSASWSENSSYASIGANTGVLTASSVTSDQACQITASYSGKSDTHDVTIRNVTAVLTSIAISGATQVNESSTVNYTCTAYFDDGSTQNVTSSANWSENSAYASIGTNTGVLTTSAVTSDQACRISATYSGNADAHDVTIKNLSATPYFNIVAPDGSLYFPQGDYIAVAKLEENSGSTSYAIRKDGSLVAGSGSPTPPQGNDFVAVSAGRGFGIAIKQDGSLVGWGSNSDGQINVPAGNDFVSVRSGVGHSLALRSNGSIVGWGFNAYGQCNVPAGNDFVAIAVSEWHFSLALRSDGTLAAWGLNDSGQCNVPAGSDYVAIAAGTWHGLALKADGAIVGWGDNWGGRAGPPPGNGNDFTAISAGVESAALKSDGTIIAWGPSDYGWTNTPPGSGYVGLVAGRTILGLKASLSKVDTIGLYQPDISLFHLKDTFTPGASDHYFQFGPTGNAGWIPLAGDWNGDGTVTVGFYQPDISLFHLKDSFAPGASDHYFQFGPGGSAGWIPLVGDWNGDGIDTIGLYQPDISLFHLKDSFTSGASDHYFQFGPGGNAGWKPLVGDWNGDSVDTIGLYQPDISLFHLKDTFTPGASDHYFQFGPSGNAGWTPLAGDWNGDGVDTIGLYQPDISLFHLKDTFTPGASDHYFQFGPGGNAGWKPLVGDWNGPETPSALHVVGGARLESSIQSTLSPAMIDSIVAHAVADWMAVGLNSHQQDLLRQVTFVVTDLPGSQLGAATETTVYLDRDAAGYGWFVDITPERDEEFQRINSSAMKAIDPQAVDRIDLLSVIEHELGHVVGFDDLDALADNLMSSTLGVGVRRTAHH